MSFGFTTGTFGMVEIENVLSFQTGETVELKKPIPFRITLLKIEHDELHMKM